MKPPADWPTILPAFEIPIFTDGRSFVVLVYEVNPELLVRDVAVFELLLDSQKPNVYSGKYKHVGLGVFGKRFVPVGIFPKFLRRLVDVAMRGELGDARGHE